MRCRTGGAFSRRNAAGQQSHKKQHPVQQALLRNAAAASEVMNMIHDRVISELEALSKETQDGRRAKTTPPFNPGRVRHHCKM